MLDESKLLIYFSQLQTQNNYTTFIVGSQQFAIMDITIDFTAQKHLTVHELAEIHYIHSITFVIPFFKLLQSSFSCLYEYISFFNDKPLIKIFIKPSTENFQFKYNVVAVGGTFDHLHFGHQMLLIYAALSAKSKLIIGITGDEMLHKKINKELIQSIQMRQNQVVEFVKKFRPDLQIQISILTDPYGPALDSKQLQCLIVSEQTQKTGKQLNLKRKQKGYAQIALSVCPIMAPIRHVQSISSIQNKISSTHIRNHLLAKNGLTIQKFTQYKEIWLEMIKKINQVSGQKQQQNHLVSRKWWDIVTKYYSQYWRFYHTNNHIFRMFKELSETPQMGYQKLSVLDQIILQISIFFHDIIYRTDLKDNQEESAKFATAFINEIFGKNIEAKKQVTEKVIAAIMTTKTHSPKSQVEKILCQLDMAILDSQPAKYQQYAVNVARQYEPLYKNEYPAKRIQFLTKVQESFKYNWRSGKNIAANVAWEIESQKKK